MTVGIGEVRLALHEGKQCRRAVWLRSEWIVLIREWSCETGHPRAVMGFAPFIAFRPNDAMIRPWEPSTEDLLAWDWEII